MAKEAVGHAKNSFVTMVATKSKKRVSYLKGKFIAFFWQALK